MPSSLLTGLLTTVVIGSAVTGYLRWVYRKQTEIKVGLRILAGMRWRELSRLVVAALGSRGFEADTQAHTAERGTQADLLLRRDGQPWLLACKQGEHYRITAAVVGEAAAAVRFNSAAGGLVVTPGDVEPEARRKAGTLQLIGGKELWPMIKPFLPAAVLEAAATEADARSRRYILLGALGALVTGIAVAWLAPAAQSPDSATPATIAAPSKALPTKARDRDDTLTAAPLSDNEQRESLAQRISELSGIERAIWSSQSTLVVYLEDDSGTDPRRAICAVMKHYQDLSASRLQLQPPPGSEHMVRFIQCQAF